MRSFRDDHDHDEDDDPQPSKASRFDGGGKPLLPRQSTAAAQDRVFPPPYPTEPPTHLENHPPKRVVFGGGGGCDVLPQWGQNKRSRGPRSERSGSGDDHFSGGRQGKATRRTISAFAMKKSTATMNPSAQTYSRARALASLMERDNGDGVSHRRTIEERTAATTSSSGVFTRQEKRLSPPSPSDKMRKTTQTSAAITSAANGSTHVDSRHPISTAHSSEQEAAAPAAPMATEKLNLDLFEWPRIYISLSRKEKEDDFLAMKGTKLPQRPKKRAKNIDKNLQYCFPGMWLSDLTKGRYEVREKKCAKKKKRGLKGMEIMESDSD